ncbi:hypothetical protein IKS57_05470 [bacterium]|nr:hypothetical protein [bacterium]
MDDEFEEELVDEELVLEFEDEVELDVVEVVEEELELLLGFNKVFKLVVE